MKVIATLEPVFLEYFAKLFSKVSKVKDESEPIIIKKSVLKTVISDNSATVKIDLKEVFKNEVDMYILNHKYFDKVLKAVKTNDVVSIVEDDDHYVIAYKVKGSNDNEYVITIPIMKYDMEFEEEEEDIDFDDSYQEFASVRINDRTILDTVRKLSKVNGTDEVTFVIDKNKVRALGVGESYVVIEKAKKFDPRKDGEHLKSTTFLLFDADDINVTFLKDNDETTIVKFTFDYGPAKIEVYEPLIEKGSLEDLL
jgi:hypothetical protein